MSTTATSAPAKGRTKAVITDRAKGERALGWKLAGPAFILMLAVTAYPILQAIWNSLFSYRLTDPAAREFVGLANYGTILWDRLFWGAVANTLFITVVTVVVETPTRLDPRQEELLRELASIRHEESPEGSVAPTHKSVFSRFRDAFNAQH